MKKRKLLATGGLVTTLLLSSPGATHAQTTLAPATSETDTDSENYDISTRPKMAEFGIQADDLTDDEDLTEISEQTFLDEGFSAAQVHRILSRANALKKHQRTKWHH